MTDYPPNEWPCGTRFGDSEPSPFVYDFAAVTIRPPEPSDWRMQFSDMMSYRPSKGQEPNRFHRLMQWLAFGFKWERVK